MHKKVWIVYYNFLEFEILNVYNTEKKAKDKLKELEQNGEIMEDYGYSEWIVE